MSIAIESLLIKSGKEREAGNAERAAQLYSEAVKLMDPWRSQFPEDAMEHDRMLVSQWNRPRRTAT